MDAAIKENAFLNSAGTLGSSRGIIIAADVATLSDLRALVTMAATAPDVVAIKIGFTLALRHGLPAAVNVVNEVPHCMGRLPLPVIYDHQKAGTDIPQMGKPFCEACREAGAQAVIFFPQAGPKTLEGFVRAALECELVPVVGLVMSHAAYLQSEGGYITDDAPDSICRTAVSLGVTNYVLPATKPDLVTRFAKGPLNALKPATIMMPGIGSQEGSLSRAFEAAGDHRRFAIIGSAIYASSDPKAALDAFSRQLPS